MPVNVARARKNVEKVFDGRVQIKRGEKTISFNEGTGNTDYLDNRVVVFEGPAFIAKRGTGQQVTASSPIFERAVGIAGDSEKRLSVNIPFDAQEVVIGDVVCVLESSDPQLVNEELIVEDIAKTSVLVWRTLGATRAEHGGA